jgi:hypothetical protein
MPLVFATGGMGAHCGGNRSSELSLLCFEKPEIDGSWSHEKVFVIGIGAGNPDYITVQAINALNKVDVFFVIDKGKEKEELLRLRK